MNLEEKAKNTLLEQAKTLKIGTREYKVYEPSLATLALYSASIAKLDVKEGVNSKTTLQMLSSLNDLKPIAQALAHLIVGCPQRETNPIERWFKKRLYEKKIRQTTEQIYNTCSLSQLFSAFADSLSILDLNLFFSLIDFLCKENILKKTNTK